MAFMSLSPLQPEMAAIMTQHEFRCKAGFANHSGRAMLVVHTRASSLASNVVAGMQ